MKAASKYVDVPVSDNRPFFVVVLFFGCFFGIDLRSYADDWQRRTTWEAEHETLR